MKLARSKLLRAGVKPAVALVALAGLAGCGEEKSDPEAVSVEELRFANNLRLIDLGNGTVRLRWSASNNEDDFSGYNIYGAKANSDIAAKEGSPIKLLDERGNPVTEGKQLLSQMSYSQDKGWGASGANLQDDESGGAEGDGESEAGGKKDDDATFEFYPYHEQKDEDGEPVTPSCLPSSSANGEGLYECQVLNKEGGGTPAEGDTGSLNGNTWFDIKNLEMDKKYCFAVVSTLEGGTQVAQTTSEVRCIIPHYRVHEDGDKKREISTNSNSFNRIELKKLREACAGGTCGELEYKSLNDYCKPDDDNGVCLESFGDGDLFLTAGGANTAIQDLGWYEKAFRDKFLPPAPKLKKLGNVQAKDGYTVKGQSLLLEKGHVYVIATAPSDKEKYYYQWLYVKSIEESGGTASLALQWRITNVAGARMNP